MVDSPNQKNDMKHLISPVLSLDEFDHYRRLNNITDEKLREFNLNSRDLPTDTKSVSVSGQDIVINKKSKKMKLPDSKEAKEFKESKASIRASDAQIKTRAITTESCPSCNNSEALITNPDDGVLECKECGVIIDSTIDNAPENHNADNDNANNSRFDGYINFFLPKSSLCSKNVTNSRLRTQQNWINMSYDERTRHKKLTLIQDICNREHLKKCIIDDAKILYKHVDDAKVESMSESVRGGKLRSYAAGCVYLAAQHRGDDRSTKEIAKMFNVKISELSNAIDTIQTILKKINTDLKINASVPENFIARFSQKLKITDQRVTKLAYKMAKNAHRLGVSSEEHTPVSIAISCLVIALDILKIKISKRKIASTFEISEVTISKTLASIKPFTRIICSNKATERAYQILQRENEKLVKKH